ncbi:putative disease resistance protein At4g11170 [Cryptomeria japonica]|uniref:putative disease resistance protein At4g11170 n=1 Tax=Cryptomeria japonica TaxID=3369 RepID=UPI0027DA157E|nr:putative disease resistance protein At4g11170 [Cryptomeria japonica]
MLQNHMVRSCTFKDFIFAWPMGGKNLKWGSLWITGPSMVAWQIWKERNKRVFREEELDVTILINRIHVTIEENVNAKIYGHSYRLYSKWDMEMEQSKLLKDLFNREEEFQHIDEGTQLLKDSLGRAGSDERFLIILDDIDHHDQLRDFLFQDLLYPGSLVIVTTRDEGVLMAAHISNRYKMKTMYGNHATELFRRHAFRGNAPTFPCGQLVEKFVEFCGGLPLSLKVLGTHVCGRDENYWKLELEKVGNIHPNEVMQCLKISFDSLEEEEKQIFMDIACFFSGKSKDMAIRIWKASQWKWAEHAVQILLDKCLVKVEHDENEATYSFRKERGDARWERIPSWIPLTQLQYLGVCRLQEMWRIPSGQLDTQDSFQLRWLMLHGCRRLRNLPALMKMLNHLEELIIIEGESSIEGTSLSKSLAKLSSLKTLSLFGVPIDGELVLSNTRCSTHLDSSTNSCMHKLGMISFTWTLEILLLDCCWNLKAISGLSSLTSLKDLSIYGCYQLESIEGIQELEELRSLVIQASRHTGVLNFISGLQRLPSDSTIIRAEAAGEAVERLNVNLFSDVIGGHAIAEIKSSSDYRHKLGEIRRSSNAIIVCAFHISAGYAYFLEDYSQLELSFYSQVEQIVTVVHTGQRNLKVSKPGEAEILKGFVATVDRGEEESKALSVFRIIVDRLYLQSMRSTINYC